MSNAAGEESNEISWPHPFRDGSIRMSTVAFNGISSEARRWFLSQLPTEIGGFLWGRFEGESVVIEDAEFVFCEAAYFNETKSDARRLTEALERKSAENLTLVGYFRSHMRADLCLSESDKRLIERHLSEPRSVFLLVRPYTMGVSMAAFFFWQNGRLQSEVSDLEIPFVALKSAGTPKTDAENEVASVVHPAPDAAPAPAVEIPAKKPNVREEQLEELPPAAAPASDFIRSRGAIYALAASTLLGIGAGWFVQRNTHSIQHVSSSAAHLQVTRRNDGQLDFSWNPKYTANAEHGTAIIREGQTVRTLPLNHAELQAGKLAYFPQTGDVDFRLDLDTSANATPLVSQSLHVVSPEPPTPKAAVRSAVYQPPKPLHRVMPSASLLRPVALAEPAEARIEVQVDTDGHVTSAQLLRQGATASPELIDSALAAARQWTFTPATLDGKPVAARHTLVFEFDGNSR